MNQDTFDPKAAAEAASEPGTFSFIDRLLGRNYPTHTVKVYLDEQTGFERTRLATRAQTEKNADEAAKLEKQIEELDKKLAASRYSFVLQGFPPERYDAIIEEAREDYPAEFEEHVHPFSGERIRKEKPNDDFENLLWAKLWAESIKEIIDPAGAIDAAGVDVGTAANMRANFPIDGRRKIDVAIQDLRMGGMWMDSIQDEAFLATP